MEVICRPSHGDKLKALLVNRKLPAADRNRVELTVEKYEMWIQRLKSAKGTGIDLLKELVSALSEYKAAVELDLIFDSTEDFLYRQKGQLKLDNTVLEEFMPYLFDPRLIPGLNRLDNISCGPHSSFAGLSFDSPLIPLQSGGVFLKLKDQDFSISKAHHITITDNTSNSDKYEAKFFVSHFASEIKTNLDKTMFQEASQTSAELKRVVPGSRYILLCEYLDMKPINTKLTSIDEVIVLRKAKRLPSTERDRFSTSEGRQKARADYESFLNQNPLHLECFERFLWHLNEIFPEKKEDTEDVVLGRGYF